VRDGLRGVERLAAADADHRVRAIFGRGRRDALDLTRRALPAEVQHVRAGERADGLAHHVAHRGIEQDERLRRPDALELRPERRHRAAALHIPARGREDCEPAVSGAGHEVLLPEWW
jgi:hypothetical protein